MSQGKKIIWKKSLIGKYDIGKNITRKKYHRNFTREESLRKKSLLGNDITWKECH